MTKIRLAIHRADTQSVLSAIQKLGLIEFTPIINKTKLTPLSKTSWPGSFTATSLEAAVLILRRHTKHPTIKSALEGLATLVTENHLAETIQTFDPKPILNQIAHWEANLNHLTAEAKALTAQKYTLLPWQDWHRPLDQPRTTNQTVEITALGNAADRAEIINQLTNYHQPITYVAVGDKALAVYCLKTDQSKILALLKKYQFNQVNLPIMPGQVAWALERIDRDLDIIANHRAAISQELSNLNHYLPQLQILTDYYKWQKACHDILDQGLSSQSVVFFEGWCPTGNLNDLNQAIQAASQRTALATLDTDEEPPVEITNPRPVRPFESITRLYGLPGHTDLDPTLFLAGFFFLFFGLSLTDIGYGLVLAGLAAWVLAWYNLPAATKSLAILLLLGGLAAMIWGVLFGGLFGLNLDTKLAWLTHWQIFDPINNPLPIFYLVLILGVIQINLGLVLAIVRDSRQGQKSAGWLDHGPWLLAFIVLGLGLINYLNWLAWPTELIWLLAGIAIIALVVTGGRRERHWLAKLGKGMLSLYGAINYLSDILSYSRLLALGLATTALAFSVNMIAGLVRDSLPIGGLVAAAIIAGLGHGFTITVNVLGAFVHSARLQFVEFFKGFIIGTGRPWRPFRREAHYISLINE